MAAVIIDNSTLTAVQRLLGTATAPSSYDAHGDYSALENFLLHLLLYDDYYHIDDYKSEFREARAKDFTFIHPVPVQSFPYREVEKEAVELTEKLILDIRGGKQQPGLLMDFLHAMKLHVTCAWHMQSSNYFLTLKILADEPDDWEVRYKYSPLTAMIFQQTAGIGVAEIARPNLVSSTGDPVSEGSNEGNRQYVVDSELLWFAGALNWLSRRAAFHAKTASHFGVATCLHPIRHQFLARWSAGENIIATSSSWRRNLGQFFGEAAGVAVNAINNDQESIEIGMNLPLLGVWAVGKTGSVGNAIAFILETAQKPMLIALRKHLAELDAIRSSGSVLRQKVGINRLRQAIEVELETLANRFGINTGVAPTVSLSADLVPVPSVSIAVESRLDRLRLKYGPARHLRALVRNVVTDVANFSELGRVRSLLLKHVNNSKAETIPALRVEERRFFGRASDWKKPM